MLISVNLILLRLNQLLEAPVAHDMLGQRVIRSRWFAEVADLGLESAFFDLLVVPLSALVLQPSVTRGAPSHLTIVHVCVGAILGSIIVFEGRSVQLRVEGKCVCKVRVGMCVTVQFLESRY